ncbi:MAG: alpha-glucosidase C-terminal domain-containing protein, partial [Oscillospiraceae bacterium]|nr:alpha-glucosidase C-terminal domain-containing protein [Oscillospiraceae bacterium]
GDIRFLDTGNEKAFAYERKLGEQKLTVVCSFSGHEETVTLAQNWSAGRVLIANGPENQLDRLVSCRMTLQPFEAFAVLW